MRLIIKNKIIKNIIITLILLTLIGCKQKDNNELKSQLLGKWKWVESSGGIDGRTETPESTGYDVTIEFTFSTMQKIVNGNLESEINYQIKSGSSIRTTQNTDLIVYENGTKQSVELNGNFLVLFEECYDCFQHNYVKE
jgi:hypothetical protein